jgi:hypothetical protein
MSRQRTFTTALAALLLAVPLAAQGVSDSPSFQPAAQVAAPAVTASPVIERTLSFAPTQASATVGVRAIAPVGALVPTPAPRAYSESPAMMIVGGVALLVGAVVGGDAGNVLMVGGGVLGLFGLWNYLR